MVGLLVNILFNRLFMVNYKQGTSTKTDLQRAILAVFEKTEMKFA
ncbi:hypothetical protein [Sporosarcina ureae]|nr:hypothetical protein [Sporosarcina ureae]